MNKHQQLMTITMEECGELIQRCSKMMRKYENIEQIEDEQREKLIDEAGDVYCMLDLLVEHGVIGDWRYIYARSSTKKEKLKKWSNLIQ